MWINWGKGGREISMRAKCSEPLGMEKGSEKEFLKPALSHQGVQEQE